MGVMGVVGEVAVAEALAPCKTMQYIKVGILYSERLAAGQSDQRCLLYMRALNACVKQ